MLSIIHLFINIFYLLVTGLYMEYEKNVYGMVLAAIVLKWTDQCVNQHV